MSRERYRCEIVVRGGALGDFALTVPLLVELARRTEKLVVAASASRRALLPEGLDVEFFDLDAAAGAWWYAPVAPPPAGLKRLLAGSRVHYFSRPDMALEAALRGHGVRAVCFHNPRPTGPPHAAWRFLTEAGIQPPPDLLDRAWLASAAPSGPSGNPCLWIHPGSGSPAKNYSPGFFRRLAQAWLRLHPEGRVCLSFGDADAGVLQTCRRLFADISAATEFVVRPSVASLRARLGSEPTLYAGNDSGVSHLAAAVGVPCIVFFRVTAPRVWRPLGRVAVAAPQADGRAVLFLGGAGGRPRPLREFQ